jgi:hypothetical protein
MSGERALNCKPARKCKLIYDALHVCAHEGVQSMDAAPNNFADRTVTPVEDSVTLCPSYQTNG